ncbi:DUF4312 family protein [Neobacillus sp. K501]
MKKTFETKVQIEGIGNSKELAINSALGMIQKKVMKEHKGLILRIEPIDLQVLEARETSYTERFFLFFFPRKRSKFKVKLEVNVNIFLIDVDEIKFEKVNEPDNVKTMILGHSVNK